MFRYVFVKAQREDRVADPPYYAFGGVWFKRREEAVIVQQCVAWRQRALRRCHSATFYEVKNAFPSVAFDEVEGTVAGALPENHEALVMQHVRGARFRLRVYDGVDCYAPGSGVLQGSTVGPMLFNYTYWVRLTRWIAEQATWDTSLVARGVVTGRPMYMGVTAFVDDVAAAHTVDKPEDLRDRVLRAADRFDYHLAAMGTTQNREKNVTMAHVSGLVSRKVLRELVKERTAAPHARYLGPMLRYDGGDKTELEQRVRAAERFLAGHGRFHMRMLVFRSVVEASLLSGLSAFVLSVGEVRRLEAVQIRLARTLLRGEACAKQVQADGTVKYAAETNDEVRRQLRLTKVHTELLVQRLRLWQELARRPQVHEITITAILDMLGAEGEANPWRAQLLADVGELRAVDDYALFVDWLGGDARRLFRGMSCEEVREFAHMDMRIFRAREHGVVVPPPGFIADEFPALAAERRNEEDNEIDCVCGQVMEDGSVCMFVASSSTQLRLHQVRAARHTHTHTRRHDQLRRHESMPLVLVCVCDSFERLPSLFVGLCEEQVCHRPGVPGTTCCAM